MPVPVQLFVDALVRELLNPASADRFTREQVATRIDGNSVQEGELAGLMSWAAESSNDAPRQAVEDPENLISTVAFEHQCLALVAGRE